VRARSTRTANAALEEVCAPDAAARRLVADAVDRGGMSAGSAPRAAGARTIADLAGEECVSALRVAEALQYRAYEARKLRPVAMGHSLLQPCSWSSSTALTLRAKASA